MINIIKLKMDWMKHKKISTILQVTFVVFVLCVVVAILVIEPNNYNKMQTNVDHKIESGWSQVVGTKTNKLDSLNDIIKDKSSNTLTLQLNLPEINQQDLTLLFYSVNQEVTAKVDGENIYEFKMGKHFAFLETPGNIWNEIVLCPEMSNKVITIEFRSNFKQFVYHVKDFYLVDNYNVAQIESSNFMFRALCALGIFLLAVFSYLNTLIFGRRHKHKRFNINYADLFLFSSIWIFSESTFINSVLELPILAYFISMLFVRALPIVFFYFIKLNMIFDSKSITGILHILWLNLFASVIAQFVFGISFISTLQLNCILILIGIIINMIHIVNVLRKKKLNFAYKLYFISTFFLMLGSAIEISFYLFRSDVGAGLGLGFASACSIFLFWAISSMLFIYDKSKLDEEIEDKRTELYQLRNAMLVKQINSHFLNNSLNAISAICKQDPQKADDGIKLLAKYMRYHANVIANEGPIEFIEEIELVQSYLEIEKIRFGDKIRFNNTIEFVDFKVPVLLLQPIVENAINHGILKKENGGTIQIDVKKINNNAVITVSDDGVGFDTQVVEKSSIALKNLRARLEITSKGNMKIKSTVGVGTKVTFTIPLDYIWLTEEGRLVLANKSDT